MNLASKQEGKTDNGGFKKSLDDLLNNISEDISEDSLDILLNIADGVESKEDYLAAFEETVYQCSETHSKGSQWRNRFCRSYKNYYGTDISIPKWDEIKSKYGVNQAQTD